MAKKDDELIRMAQLAGLSGSSINASDDDKELNERLFDYGHEQDIKHDYEEMEQLTPITSGKKNIDLRIVNNQGDNPIKLSVKESVDNVALMLREHDNSVLKSAFTKIMNKNYTLNENETVSIANAFISLLKDKSHTKFDLIKSLICNEG